MNHTLTIAPVRVGMDTVLRIPSAWTLFVFNGFIYKRDEFGRFVVRGEWAKKTA